MEFICNNIPMLQVAGINRQLQIFRFYICLCNQPDIIDQFLQINILLFNRKVAAFNPAHIQHIIDQRKQMLARYGDHVQIVPYQLAVICVFRSETCESDDGIHRRSHVMGHVVQKSSLRPVGRLLFYDYTP